MIKGLISAVIGTRHDRERRKIQPIVDEINSEYERLHGISEEELRKIELEALKYQNDVIEADMELDLARRIQESFLPQSLPHLSGVRFAVKYNIPRAEFWPLSLRAVAHED